MSSPASSAPRILVIEDDGRLRAMLEKGLRRAGFEPVGVPEGATGVSVAMSPRAPDLIVLDLGLPDMDGIEVMERLRAHGVSIPVLVLSARDAESERVGALSGGAADYVTKPFSFAELLARIRLRLPEAPPLPAAPAMASGPQPSSPLDEVAASEDPRPGPRGRALVIEDEHRIGLFLTKGLAADGLEAVVAEDGEVGAFLATTEPFNVVVLDLGLPGVDGFEVLARLRSQVPWLPVVVFTGQDDPQVRRRAEAEGAAAFVTKPLVVSDLRKVIESVIEAGPNPDGL